MKPEIKVGQVREQEADPAMRAKVRPESIAVLARNDGRGDWKVQHIGGRVSRLKTASILRRYPVVVKDAPPEAKAEQCGRLSPEGYPHPGTPCSLPSDHDGPHEARDASGALLAKSTPPAAKADVHEEHCTMDACKYGDPKCSMAPRALPIHPRDSLAQRLGVTPEAKAEADDCSCAAVCDNPDSCPRVCTPPAAPSPLEVVRGNVLRWLEVGHEGLPSLRTRAEASLATLEESIRADERRKALARIHPGVVEMLDDQRHDGHRFRWAVKCLTCTGK